MQKHAQLVSYSYPKANQVENVDLKEHNLKGPNIGARFRSCIGGPQDANMEKSHKRSINNLKKQKMIISRYY